MADRTDIPLTAEQRAVVGPALANLPGGLWVLTASHEDRRSGMLVSFVQQACFEPPMLSIALAKGQSIMPIISESRRFALCQIGDDDRVAHRKFSVDHDPHDDPFLGFELVPPRQPGLAILRTSVGYLECELSCHMDIEGDHDLFIGRVIAGASHGGQPILRLREDGFEY